MEQSMSVLNFRLGLLPCLLMLLAGCATTGDPRQGGLFGWSEEQAIARKESLEQSDRLAQQQAATEQQRTSALGGRQAELARTRLQLEAELGRLLEENDKLDTQLRGLMQRQQVGQNDATRLRKMLADNAKLRLSTRASATGGALPPVEAVNDQNARLQREVMILLQR
jgi:hypothetical protein